MNKTIIGIDCGKAGGIAVYNNGRAQAFKMPETVKELSKFFQYIENTYEDKIVFIEKVQSFKSDTDDGGKRFGIDKMLKNYAEIITVIKLIGWDFVEVYPISWQSTLGLKKGTKGLSKTQRKNIYKTHSQNAFPECKVTLNVADALCLISFAFRKFENDPDWINERIVDGEKSDLFN